MTRHRRQRQALVLDADGPPNVQRVAHVEQRPVPGRPAETVTVIHEQRIRHDEWSDPEDTGTRARHHGARKIAGWRRHDVLRGLHNSSPREFTAAHLAAGNRMRRDYEIAMGASAGWKPEAPVDGSNDRAGYTDTRLDAQRRAREAIDAVGGPNSQAAITLVRVVIQNWDLTDLANAHHTTRDYQKGRVQAGLDRLKDHYAPPPPPRQGSDVVYTASDGLVADLPPERLGRFRVPGGAA